MTLIKYFFFQKMCQSEIVSWFESITNGCKLRFDRELANMSKKALKIISRNDTNLYYKSKFQFYRLILKSRLIIIKYRYQCRTFFLELESFKSILKSRKKI